MNPLHPDDPFSTVRVVSVAGAAGPVKRKIEQGLVVPGRNEVAGHDRLLGHNADPDVAARWDADEHAPNQVDWRASAEHWRDVIVQANGAPIARSEAIALAGRLIGYLLAGDRVGAASVDRLRLSYAETKRWDPHGSQPMPKLPAPVVG